MRDKIIIITGPTASGKSDIAIQLALKIDAEIVYADSAAVYKNMDIGTAKPDDNQRALVKHHLIDICEIDDEYSAAAFKKDALKAIEQIRKRGKRIIVTGGTGLYLDTLLYDIDFSDNLNNALKEETKKFYENYLERHGKEKLFKLLVKRDFKAAHSTHMNNTKRVIRYLTILHGYEGSLEQYQKSKIQDFDRDTYSLVVLDPDRQHVYDRINRRVDIMLEKGLLEEVKGFLKDKSIINLNSMQAIGYKETIAYLLGYCTYDEMVEILKRNTRNYAKRQFTWLRKYKHAHIVDMRLYPTIDSAVSHILKIISAD